MPTIVICDVPERVHQALLVRAESAGISLSEFLLREMTRLALLDPPVGAERSSLAEIMARAEQRKPLKPVTEDATRMIRERRGC